jgi:hypothetical protein
MAYLTKLLRKLRTELLRPVTRRLDLIADRLERIQLNTDFGIQSLGRIETRQMAKGVGQSINDFEFKVYSQWGEDGIIQFLIQKIPIQNKIFVEFGVDDYKEANTRFLLINNNWSGLVIENKPEAINQIKSDRIYWLYNIKVVNEFITRENINKILEENGVIGDIGLLSIDIDGNDYWIWEAIEVIKPVIVIIEYNYRFGRDQAVTIPYDKSFDHTVAHNTQIYYGASLSALCLLGNRMGYSFIGCCSNGVNAFFVRKDKKPLELKELSSSEGFFEGKYSELRDLGGSIIKSTPEHEINLIKELGLPLIDVAKE